MAATDIVGESGGPLLFEMNRGNTGSVTEEAAPKQNTYEIPAKEVSAVF